MEDLRGRFNETSRDGFLLAQDISSYSLTIVAHEAKSLCQKVEVSLQQLILVVSLLFKTTTSWVLLKQSLEANVKYLALDLGEDNIRVNAISAGPIRT